MRHGDIHLKRVEADRIGRKGNEASSYGERWRVGLHFTQPSLPKSLSMCHFAPSKARRILRGESPRRVRVSHPPVSSLACVAEPEER